MGRTTLAAVAVLAVTPGCDTESDADRLQRLRTDISVANVELWHAERARDSIMESDPERDVLGDSALWAAQRAVSAWRDSLTLRQRELRRFEGGQ